jgi:hypothetical protein
MVVFAILTENGTDSSRFLHCPMHVNLASLAIQAKCGLHSSGKTWRPGTEVYHGPEHPRVLVPKSQRPITESN